MKNKFYSRVIWLTGLSGSGKTTISEKLYQNFCNKKYQTNKIDGDFVRKKTNNTKDFSRKSITKNNNLIINRVKNIYKRYDYTIVSVISPLRATRLRAKKIFGKNYFEVYVNCGIKELIKRDTKGLYKLAKEKKIKNLVGYKSKILYETSKYKVIYVNTKKLNLQNSVKKILNKVK